MGRKRQPYYPLKPGGKRYRSRPFVVLSIAYQGLEGDYITGSLLNDQGELERFADPRGLLSRLQEEKNKTWFLVYDIDRIAGLFSSAVETFDKISGIGRTAQSIRLVKGDCEYWIVDVRSFFMEPIEKVMEVMGETFPDYPGDGAGLGEWIDYTTTRAGAILKIWLRLCGLLRDTFNIYPSRSPGATALKCWRSTIDRNFHARSRLGRPFLRGALRAGALHWEPGYYPQAWLYDLNASYPAVMAGNKYPVRYRYFINRAPPLPRWIATVNLSYTCAAKFSPLQVTINEDLSVHPAKIEQTNITLTDIDFQSLERTGAVTIHKWIEGVCWTPEMEEPIFEKWGAIVDNASQDPETKLFLKVASRALHSKFSQNERVTVTEIKQVTPRQLSRSHYKGVKEFIPLENGKLAVKIDRTERTKFVPYMFPDYEALTLAWGRAAIYAAMDPDTVYIDTDCIISTRERPDLPIGSHMGQWKLAYSGPCVVAGPRMYAFPKRVKSAGIFTPDRAALERAIWGTARGMIESLRAVERGGLLAGGPQTERNHTIRRVTYPKAEIIGNKAYVTRSPTRLYHLKRNRRKLT